MYILQSLVLDFYRLMFRSYSWSIIKITNFTADKFHTFF